jgi:radical SAM protein with 4Fe4S-binding SPASM domain
MVWLSRRRHVQNRFCGFTIKYFSCFILSKSKSSCRLRSFPNHGFKKRMCRSCWVLSVCLSVCLSRKAIEKGRSTALLNSASRRPKMVNSASPILDDFLENIFRKPHHWMTRYLTLLISYIVDYHLNECEHFWGGIFSIEDVLFILKF